MRFFLVRGLAVGGAVLLAACAANMVRLSAAPLHAQVFDGHWLVDPTRSEDPDAVAAATGGKHGMGGGHGHGGGMVGGGMGGGSGGMGDMGGGGRHGGDGTGSAPHAVGSENGENLRRALLLPDTLDIAMQPGALMLTPDGRARTIPLVSGQSASAQVTRAGWDADTLVVIIHTGAKHADIVQRYTVTPDHTRLTVTTEWKGNSKTVSVVREFTAAPAGARPATT